jgi:hypothetical protein
MKKTFFKGNRNSNYVEVKLNTDKLEELTSTLLSAYFTRVGILGSKTDRMKTIAGKRTYGWGETKTVVAAHKKSRDEASTKTNAEIGLKHEFGLGVPRRSFLELPLFVKSSDLMQCRKELQDVVFAGEGESLGKWKHAYKMLGIYAENIIQEAFETGGFGQWQADSDITIAKKGSSMALIDTGQLRASITSDVVTR